MQTALLPQVCKSCGNVSLPDGKFCLFCGDLLTEHSSRVSRVLQPSTTIIYPVADTPATTEYAGFWLRVWAGLIDITLEAAVAFLLASAVDFGLHSVRRGLGITTDTTAYLTGITFIALLTVGAWLYSAFSESSRWRATLGKRLIGLEVVNAQGGRLTFGQASVRHLMKFLSLFTLCVGFMMAGWTRRRQALHDMPADTFVVRLPKPTISLFGH